MKTGLSGLARVRAAAGHSLRGLTACWAHEAAFRQGSVLAGILFVLAFFLARNVEQWLWLVAPLFALLVVELFNSAIECVVDRIGPERHVLSGRAKDLASAGVLLCLAFIAISWTAIAWNNLLVDGAAAGSQPVADAPAVESGAPAVEPGDPSAQPGNPAVEPGAPAVEPGDAEPACVVTPPAEPLSCTMEYQPVCGCDGKTYSNACVARAAGVPRWTAGSCGGEDQL